MNAVIVSHINLKVLLMPINHWVRHITCHRIVRNSQPRNQHLKKRIKPMSMTPLATTGPTVAPSSLPVAMLDISTRRKHNVSKRKRCREWPKQIWEYPKWPFLPPGTIDMEEKRVSELQRKSPPDPNSSHHPSR